MDSKQAKDFLLQQVVEQAAFDGVSLSDLEKKMMYFTEGDASCEDPIKLNEQFEAQYDTAKYEAKMSGLLHHAYERLKSEDPERLRQWSLSIRTLREGDHYLLVLWDSEAPSDHPVRDFLKPVGVGMLIALAIFVAMMVAAKFDIHLDKVGMRIVVGVVVLLALLWSPVSNWLQVRRAELRRSARKSDRT